MAIIRTGALVGGISGTLGGVVFVAGRGSPVVRPRPLTKNKSSPFLAASRASMFTLRRAWSSLTSLQKSAWETRAVDFPTTNALGVSSPISGFQLFIKLNIESRLDSESFIPDPTDFPVSGPPTNVAAAFSESVDFIVSADPPSPMLLGTYYVFGWPFWRTTESRDVPRLVFLAQRTGPSLFFNVRSAWELHFGPMSENQRFAIAVGFANIFAFRGSLVELRAQVAA